MSRLAVTFAVLALTLVSICPTTSDAKSAATVSAADRYEAHPQPLEVLKSAHRFDLDPSPKVSDSHGKDRQSLDNDIVPDLQVGCGDGLFVETASKSRPVESKSQEIFARKERRKREAANGRKPRDYFGYSIYTPASISYSLNYKTVFKPAPYPVQRPYYIPIWGTKDKFPLYFPPQGIFIQPPFGLDEIPDENDNFPPSKPATPPPSTEAPVELPPRFGDMPIWGSFPAESRPTIAPPQEPTRSPSRPKTSTFPPLVHVLNPTNRPPRLDRPFEAQTEAAPIRPARTTPSSVAAPNKCAFAIVNCCSAGSENVRMACFERLGCPGPFWDKSPCEGGFANRAIDDVMTYFQRN